jgi:hypothetical protein
MTKLGLLFLLCAVGCGDNGVPAGGEPDLSAAADLATSGGGGDLKMSNGGDMAYNPPLDAGPLSCGTGTCTTNQVCCAVRSDGGFSGASCTAANACGGNDLPIECRGPEYCGGKPCCLTLVNRMPQSILCTAAQTDCSPALDTTGSGKTRLCHTSADCTAGAPTTGFPDCCSGMQGGVQQQFCFNKGFTSFVPGITCP